MTGFVVPNVKDFVWYQMIIYNESEAYRQKNENALKFLVCRGKNLDKESYE